MLTGQYEDPEGQAIYYRIPLGAIAAGSGRDGGRTRSGARGDDDESRIDLASGLTRPFARRAAVARGDRAATACCTGRRSTSSR